MKTIGHHTCSNIGGAHSVFDRAPFRAIHDETKDKYQFLGTGYYFWDNNLELAKVWGKNHYFNQYVVVEVDFELTEANCYDLVGNRNHQIDIIKKMKDLRRSLSNSKSENWSISNYITFMRNASKINKDIFPFEMVRAIDLLDHIKYSKKQYKIKFVDSKHNYTVLNPKIVICVFDKNSLDLNSKRVVHPTH